MSETETKPERFECFLLREMLRSEYMRSLGLAAVLCSLFVLALITRAAHLNVLVGLFGRDVPYIQVIAAFIPFILYEQRLARGVKDMPIP
jgi:hypothetical protein